MTIKDCELFKTGTGAQMLQAEAVNNGQELIICVDDNGVAILMADVFDDADLERGLVDYFSSIEAAAASNYYFTVCLLFALYMKATRR